MDIRCYNLSISVLFGYRESLSSVTPDQERIPHRNKWKKTSDILIAWEKHFKEPVNPNKWAQEETIPDVEINSPKERNPLFWHNADFKGDTNEKTTGSNDSPSENNGCMKTWSENMKMKRIRNSKKIILR